MTEENEKLKARVKNLEGLAAVQMHNITILKSEVALLKMAVKVLGQQKVMIVAQDKKEEDKDG